ncbi:MAG: SDR family NAD(P)-dependent oxidoreductase [Actinomycetota bacterium]|nr:SDR family NAD(P)-dependent oxidoreductase [Actinomycetota bacterium]
MELDGQHVLITGASRGIGAAMAKEFGARGAKVSVAARSADALRSVAAAVGGQSFPVDLLDSAAVDGLIPRVEAEAGPIHVLVNNAGLETSAFFHTLDRSVIRDVTRLNLEAPMVLTRAVLDEMLTRNHGHLLFVSSLAGTGGFPGLAAYCATKAGLTNFAATLALELKDTEVGTTVIASGPVDTPMWDSLENAEQLAPMLTRLRLLRLVPNKSPESIAKVAVDAVASGKPYVGLPRRLGANHLMRNLPSKITGIILAGVPLGPQPKKP